MHVAYDYPMMTWIVDSEKKGTKAVANDSKGRWSYIPHLAPHVSFSVMREAIV